MEDFKLENVIKCLENYEGKIRKERNHGSEPLQEPLTLMTTGFTYCTPEGSDTHRNSIVINVRVLFHPQIHAWTGSES